VAQHTETLRDITTLQDRIIQMIAAKPPDDSWVEIVVSFEVEGEDGGETTDYTIFAVCKSASGFHKLALFFEIDEEDLFLELRRLYRALNDTWSTVDVRLLRDGRFTFDFEYGPPKCLNGDMDAIRRFDTYLDGYEQKHLNDLESAE